MTKIIDGLFGWQGDRGWKAQDRGSKTAKIQDDQNRNQPEL